jgi:hypothetical protein
MKAHYLNWNISKSLEDIFFRNPPGISDPMTLRSNLRESAAYGDDDCYHGLASAGSCELSSGCR